MARAQPAASAAPTPTTPVGAVDLSFDEPEYTELGELSDGYFRVRFAVALAGSYRSLAEARARALEVIDKLNALPAIQASDIPEMRVGKHGELLECAPETQWSCYGDARNGELVRTAIGCMVCSEKRVRELGDVGVTVERSSDLHGLTPGYYVVVIASGGERRIAEVVRRARAVGIPAWVRHVQSTLWSCGE